MVPTSLNRTVDNIGDTVKKHDNIVQDILSLHSWLAMTQSVLYTALEKWRHWRHFKKYSSTNVRLSRKDMSTLLIEAIQFIASCYGITQFRESMSDLRFKILKSKTGRSSFKAFLSCHLSLQHMKPSNYIWDVHITRQLSDYMEGRTSTWSACTKCHRVWVACRPPD